MNFRTRFLTYLQAWFAGPVTFWLWTGFSMLALGAGAFRDEVALSALGMAILAVSIALSDRRRPAAKARSAPAMPPLGRTGFPDPEEA